MQNGNQIIEYIRDWACPVKRLVLIDIPLVGFDLAFLVYLGPLLGEMNQWIQAVVGITAATLTTIRIIDELSRMWDEWKGKKGNNKRKKRRKDEEGD